MSHEDAEMIYNVLWWIAFWLFLIAGRSEIDVRLKK